jgi:DNA invertase Pin-like site-specific DNA recombinase
MTNSVTFNVSSVSHSPIRWGYHRVSTVHSQSLELGHQELIDAGIPADKIWSEQVSGKSKENRPELKALQPGIEINVCKLDRLARNVEDVLEIAEKIRKTGATLNILDLKIDTSSPVGELILTVLGACAQLERSTIRARTAAGIEAYRAKGGKMGPKPKPERNARIRKKVKGGMSWEEVARD